MSLVKLLILIMLFDDDEHLNLIFNEAQITEDNKEFLKSLYNEAYITQDDIKDALKELKNEGMILLLKENGEELNCTEDEFNLILSSTTEWEYWFRITNLGKEFFDNTFSKFFREERINR